MRLHPHQTLPLSPPLPPAPGTISYFLPLDLVSVGTSHKCDFTALVLCDWLMSLSVTSSRSICVWRVSECPSFEGRMTFHVGLEHGFLTYTWGAQPLGSCEYAVLVGVQTLYLFLT